MRAVRPFLRRWRGPPNPLPPVQRERTHRLFRRLRDAGVVRVRRPVGGRPRVVEAGARIDARDFMHKRDAVLDRTDQNA
jgi:hypothetical protein